MDYTDAINSILGVTESYKAPVQLMEILRDKPRREQVFRNLLEVFDYDVSYDWFHEYFQDEHADRKKKKQDFTPMSVSRLLIGLVGDGNGDGSFYDPCAGTGGITIAKWDHDRMQHSPFDYRPSMYLYHCEELSERALPFLLANVMIRGMNAAVVHCDVLTRKAYGVFFVQNDNDDHLQFSNIYRMPYTDAVSEFFGVQLVEERYGEFDKPGELPRHLFGDITVADLKAVVGE